MKKSDTKTPDHGRSFAGVNDRAAGAVMGALIGDALGVGPHWYYDLDEMRRHYGDWITDYTDPQPHRYHAGLKAGQLSQAGIITSMLLRSTVEHDGYNEEDFCRRLDEELFPQLDGTPMSGPGGYTSQSIREAWRRRVDFHAVTSDNLGPPKPGDPDPPRVGRFSSPDALLTPSYMAEAALDPGIKIEPAWKVSIVYGMPCAIYHQLPAAYYLAARFAGDFESAVLHALNGGGQNQARCILTGALVGAQVGISRIPQRFVDGLEKSTKLTSLACELGRQAER